jgi:hemerythrin-like domain-containing protein
MAMQSGKAARSGLLSVFTERIPDNVLLEPIEYLFADHCRQADMCHALKKFVDHLSETAPDQELAAAMLSCLENDLSLHIADEEVDLFPRLRVRAKPEDHITDLLRLIDREHSRDRTLAEDVRTGLKNIVNKGVVKSPNQFCRAASALVASHVSHLEWENAVLLPLARKCLTSEDLDAMGRSMAARRSIPYPGE